MTPLTSARRAAHRNEINLPHPGSIAITALHIVYRKNSQARDIGTCELGICLCQTSCAVAGAYHQTLPNEACIPLTIADQTLVLTFAIISIFDIVYIYDFHVCLCAGFTRICANPEYIASRVEL